MRNLFEDFKGKPIRLGLKDGKFMMGVLSEWDDMFVKLTNINCGSFEMTQYIAIKHIVNFSQP